MSPHENDLVMDELGRCAVTLSQWLLHLTSSFVTWAAYSMDWTVYSAGININANRHFSTSLTVSTCEPV